MHISPHHRRQYKKLYPNYRTLWWQTSIQLEKKFTNNMTLKMIIKVMGGLREKSEPNTILRNTNLAMMAGACTRNTDSTCSRSDATSTWCLKITPSTGSQFAPILPTYLTLTVFKSIFKTKSWKCRQRSTTISTSKNGIWSMIRSLWQKTTPSKLKLDWTGWTATKANQPR